MRASGRVRGLVLAWLCGGVVPVAMAAPPVSDPEQELPGLEDTDGGSETGSAGETDGPSAAAIEAEKEAQYRDRMLRAKRAGADERWRDAVNEYTSALELRDGDLDALIGRARARWQGRIAGRPCARQAIEDLALVEVLDPLGDVWAEARGDLVEWMGECGAGYARERLRLAEELAVEAIGSPGRHADIRLVAAQLRRAMATEGDRRGKSETDLAQALVHIQAYAREYEEGGRTPSGEALELLGDIEKQVGHADPALRAYKELLRLHPDYPRVARVHDRIAELEIQTRLLEFEQQQGVKPLPEADAAYRRGIQALRGGNLSVARSELERAVEISPWFPQAHHQLGEVYARTDRLPLAVESFKKAILMEPYDPAPHVALGLLYKKRFMGSEDDQALHHLDLALRVRPDLDVLHFHLGELYARSDKPRAREHFRRFIEGARSEDPMLDAASAALRDLDREVEEVDPWIPPPQDAALRLLDPDLHRLIMKAYLLGADYGDWDSAEKLLLQGRADFPQSPELLNMLAQVADAQQRPGDARRYWEESLSVQPEQMDVHERLGSMLLDSGGGVAHLRKAADLGSVSARFKLAERLWDDLELWSASEQLDVYLREAGWLDVNWDAAQALRERMDALFLRIYLGFGALVSILVATPVWFLYRRIRGASLQQLLARAPKSYPEVARILSLVRHEILKHNTSFLSDVGRALEMDEHDADARAHLLARRLFGDSAGARELGSVGLHERRGIHGRFLGYLSELEKVGRAHGVTLNLNRKDETFRAMVGAFNAVARHADELRHPGGIRAGKRLELSRVLQHSGDVLGRKAFESLSGMIQTLCIAEVSPSILQDVYDRVRGEAQFSNTTTTALDVHGDAVRVRIFRTDLEDILANVFRNSLHSSLQYAVAPFGLGVDLVTEVDDITGLASVAIRVKDRSKERLTNEMLRGRYVERGMGITADLLSRYDGSIAVESEPNWAKAVVLRFFALEEQQA